MTAKTATKQRPAQVRNLQGPKDDELEEIDFTDETSDNAETTPTPATATQPMVAPETHPDLLIRLDDLEALESVRHLEARLIDARRTVEVKEAEIQRQESVFADAVSDGLSDREDAAADALYGLRRELTDAQRLVKTLPDAIERRRREVWPKVSDELRNHIKRVNAEALPVAQQIAEHVAALHQLVTIDIRELEPRYSHFDSLHHMIGARVGYKTVAHAGFPVRTSGATYGELCDAVATLHRHPEALGVQQSDPVDDEPQDPEAAERARKVIADRQAGREALTSRMSAGNTGE